MKSGSESPFKSAIVILHEMYGPKYAVCGFDHVPEALEVTYVTFTTFSSFNAKTSATPSPSISATSRSCEVTVAIFMTCSEVLVGVVEKV